MLTLWNGWFRRKPRSSPRQRVRFRPSVEALETRALLSFGSVASFPAGSLPIGVAAADFNHDGKMDLVTADNSNTNTIKILAGNGDGTFQAPVSLAGGGS